MYGTNLFGCMLYGTDMYAVTEIIPPGPDPIAGLISFYITSPNTKLLQFTRNPQMDGWQRKPFFYQSYRETMGKNVIVYNLSADIISKKQWVITINKEVYGSYFISQLFNFIENYCRGLTYPFYFTDIDGTVTIVRLMNANDIWEKYSKSKFLETTLLLQEV